jgi:rare lipoprotein A
MRKLPSGGHAMRHDFRARRPGFAPGLLTLLLLAGCAAQTPPPARLPPVRPVPAPAPAPEPAPPPIPRPYFIQTGMASFYGAARQGRTTAGGARFDAQAFTAAHPSLAFGTVVRVTNLDNGRTVTVEINDRGPHIQGRVIDLSLAAARALGMEKQGLARVRLEAYRADQDN